MIRVLAFDRASVRRKDADGRLHVERAHISAANVCPYYGREIPDWEALGLDPDKIYYLYRDAEELKKAAPTFNNLPILSEHQPVSADNHDSDLVIGTTGTDADFSRGFLDNSLAFWPQAAIDDIEDDRKKQLSSAYRYRAEMTPGMSPAGDRYDGVMRDIIGNHVALVREGRAGPEVVVGDETMRARDATAHDPHTGQFTAGPGASPSTKGEHRQQAAYHKKEADRHYGAMQEHRSRGNLKGEREARASYHENRKAAEHHEVKGREEMVPTGRGSKSIPRSQVNRTTRALLGWKRGDKRPLAGDSKEEKMKLKMTPRGLMTAGALGAYLQPRLAADARIPVGAMVRDLTRKNLAERLPAVAAAVRAAVRGRLAQDADLEDLDEFLDAIQGEKMEEDAEPEDVDVDMEREPVDGEDDEPPELLAKIREFLKDHLSPEVLAKFDEMVGEESHIEAEEPPAKESEDEDPNMKPNDKPNLVTKEAMDAAIAAAVKSATTAASANATAVRDAENAVRPWVGDLHVAFDSAEGVYRAALDSLGVKHSGVHASALRTILEMTPRPTPNARPTQAQDAKSASGFASRFPNAARIERI